MNRKNDVLLEVERKYRKRHWIGIVVAVFVLLAGLGTFLQVTHILLPKAPSNSEPGISSAEKKTIETSSSTSSTETALSSIPTEFTVSTEATLSSDDLATVLLKGMTLEEKICQVFLVQPEALGGNAVFFDESSQAALELYPVGGIILFSDNLETRKQCTEIIQDYQNASKVPLFIGVDEEGGYVSRLGSDPDMGVPHFPPMQEIGNTMDQDAAYNVGHTLGVELAALGFNLDFAPVADVNTNPDNPVIGSRAFSTDAKVAADMVRACVSGFRDAGMISCIKHFPGHGDTQTDTHLGNAETGKTLYDMGQEEFLPFKAGISAGAPTVMVGHISCPNITGDQVPASLSFKLITNVLRKDLGFDGVVITDAMNMGAIAESYPSGEAAVLALEAGCDIVLIPENLQEATAAIRSALASGRLTEERLNESVLRILRLKLEYDIIPQVEASGIG